MCQLNVSFSNSRRHSSGSYFAGKRDTAQLQHQSVGRYVADRELETGHMRAARAAGHDPPVLVVCSGRGGSVVGVGGHRTWACTEHIHAMGQDLYRRRFGSVFFFCCCCCCGVACAIDASLGLIGE